MYFPLSVSRARVWLGVCLLLCLCALPWPTHAGVLLAVVSERAAPTALAAARRHLAQHPQDRVLLRTPAQWQQASAREQDAWLRSADSVLAVAVFGDAARALKTSLARSLPPQANLLAFNGEASLSLQSRWRGDSLRDTPPELLRDLSQETPPPAALSAAERQPLLARWLRARQWWQAGGADNAAALFAYALRPDAAAPAPQPEPAFRLRAQGREQRAELSGEGWLRLGATLGLRAAPTVLVLDLANAETDSADALCRAIEARGLACAALFSRWGGASRQALEQLPALLAPARPAALVVMQDFVVGAADGREAVSTALTRLNVPVFKAIRLTERSQTQWRLSSDGLPADSVQYRVALPELQGIGQPHVISALGPAQRDAATGLALRRPQALPAEIQRLASRVARWHTLRSRANADKRVAIIYYNHPPGRQNIGADNLDVPNTLFDLLHRLQAAGYATGPLPASPQALLDQIMAHGVNLPEDAAGLAAMSGQVAGMSAADYTRRLARLPARVRDEMQYGPLGRLHAEVLEAEAAGEWVLGRKRVEGALKELHHLLSGVSHPQRELALAQLQTLQAGYLRCLAEARQPRPTPCARLGGLAQQLSRHEIEGLRGWGASPGRVMVSRGRLVFPGLRFGQVFIGPQPPRGWEVDEELLHANTSITPPHQYLAFYQWLRDDFAADVLVHVGRHSTYEFLPGKAVGLAADDYPSLIADDLPSVYPYIVDGVGEGTQAKRRGQAVIVDHLTPPLAATPLYDRLLNLRQLVESYEAASSDSLKAQAAQEMRAQVQALNLRAELEASMADVLEVRGIGFDAADDDLLAHEIGHYLTKLQEKFMPHGLHVFGRPWSDASLQLMLDSMRQGGVDADAAAGPLRDSPAAEMDSLLNALAGGHVPPGKGNDPLRSPEALPTGRNFHAVDGDLLPTRLGYALGARMAARAADGEGSEGVILWASDAVRDEGVMVGFALALMGAEPVWNARGIVTDVRLLPDARRRDVIVTTSGLFRDLYPHLLRLIDRAGRLALAASAAPLRQAHPELAPALDAALAPVPGAEAGEQPLADNRVAQQWLRRLRALVAQGQPLADAGRAAALRLFGDAPGAYGAGVNRLTERSAAWRERDELARAYRLRMGHGYGLDADGEASHAALDAALDGIARTYHGRASHLYGLLDNNDAFDYLGGLSLAVESRVGAPPQAWILQHADPGRAGLEPLASALLGELRGRFLNPAWLRPLMAHGYAGARTMGQEFLENLWGWQVTRPDLVQSWAWDEVKSVYFDDAHQLGLPRFLAEGHNAHAKAHMLAIMMVAAQRGYWRADADSVRRLGGELAQLVARNGLPGSGHTSPHHPMWAWLAEQLSADDAQALQGALSSARGADSSAGETPTPSAAALPRAAHTPTPRGARPQASAADAPAPLNPPRWRELRLSPPPAAPVFDAPWAWLAGLGALLLALGLWRGLRSPHPV